MPAFPATFQSSNEFPSQWTVLLSLDTMAVADFVNGDNFIGTSGVRSASPTAVANFDFRQFRYVMMVVQMGAITGTTPTVRWAIDQMPRPESDFSAHGASRITPVIGASGGTGVMILGAGLPFRTNSTDDTFTGPSTTAGVLYPFGRIVYTVTGSPTALGGTNRLDLYGIR